MNRAPTTIKQKEVTNKFPKLYQTKQCQEAEQTANMEGPRSARMPDFQAESLEQV